MISTQIASTHDFDATVHRMTELLAEEGFGILTTIDMQAKFLEKLGRESEPYLILGACNPALAWDAVGAVPELGVLLPCNVVVRQTGPQVTVDIMNPKAAMELIPDPKVAEVATEAQARLERVAAKF